MKQKTIHLWETVEVVLHAKQAYDNPYTDVVVWVDLEGPNFCKRVFGFWDGGDVFKVRVTGTAPGLWNYVSGASVQDEGLCGVCGAFIAMEWSEAEKQENPTRRGLVVASDNGRAMQYADGTPYIMVGDTWWALATKHFPWVEDEQERPVGPDMSMKDMARVRRRQGYNTIGMIAAFPTWADDGMPGTVIVDDGKFTYIRSAWTKDGSPVMGMRGKVYPAKDMDNEGGRAFEFPGKVPGYENIAPDFDRINPEYFKVLDKKMDWLNANGFTIFIEVMRRDCSTVFKHYHDWPMVYTRYIQYLFARYQTNNILFSPIHFDVLSCCIDGREFNEAINLFVDLYGQPPFGTLLGTNANPHSMTNYGDEDEQHWLTFHQLGNKREHDYFWHLTDSFHKYAIPQINGEPYYSGHLESTFLRDEEGDVVGLLGLEDTEADDDQLNCRCGYYGSILSGAYGGILAGYEAGWNANTEPDCAKKLWEIMEYAASEQVRHIQSFLMVEGLRYQELIPCAELLTPNKAGEAMSYRGWAFAAATKKRDFILGYTEKDCPRVSVRGLHPYDIYRLTWFDPRTGEWLTDKSVEIEADPYGEFRLPAYPSDSDWGFMLKRVNGQYRLNPPRDFSRRLNKIMNMSKNNG